MLVKHICIFVHNELKYTFLSIKIIIIDGNEGLKLKHLTNII